jgi:anti-sigma regulatory factor (Ser/Thr protein kinase)
VTDPPTESTTRAAVSPLTITDAPPFVVGRLSGDIGREATPIILSAFDLLLPPNRTGLALALDSAGVLDAAAADALVRLIREAARLGRDTRLIRASPLVMAKLRAAGLRAGYRHANALGAATGGAARDERESLSLRLRPSLSHVRKVRLTLKATIGRLGISADQTDAVMTAVVEAVNNAIQYGAPDPETDSVEIVLAWDPLTLCVDVYDCGRGFAPSEGGMPAPETLPERGFGLALMRRLTDSVDVFASESGTLVRLTFARAAAERDAAADSAAIK